MAFDKFPKLKDSLWKVVGLKLAVPLLQKVSFGILKLDPNIKIRISNGKDSPVTKFVFIFNLDVFTLLKAVMNSNWTQQSPIAY